MKSTELRIGNLVNYKNINVPLCIEDFAEWDKNLGDIIKPIELTEEWLIKFGFEKKEVEKTYYFLRINYSSGFTDYIQITDIAGDSDTPIYLFDLESDYERSFVLPFQYKYVHQLQNLYFALTGEELTIKE